MRAGFPQGKPSEQGKTSSERSGLRYLHIQCVEKEK